jgi:hypothetical protein
VRGEVHTNSVESFWSLLKRGVLGTYHNVSKKYLPLYLAEFQYRFNNRGNENIFFDVIAGCGGQPAGGSLKPDKACHLIVDRGGQFRLPFPRRVVLCQKRDPSHSIRRRFMKHSSTWFVLILIASALLISAARNARGEPNSNAHTNKSDTDSRDYVANGKPIAIPTDQPLRGKAAPRSNGDTYNYNNTFKYIAPANPGEGFWKSLGDVATVASAIAVAVFTLMLWSVSEQQKKLMENAEAISRRSVEAAENSLDIYRPFLLVTNVAVEIRHSDFVSDADIQIRHHFLVNVALKNFGVSPADIIDYTAAAEPLDPPKRPDFIDPPVWYGAAEYLYEPIIGPGEAVPDRIHTGNGFTDREYQTLAIHEKRIAIYGRIHYRGASQKVFETRFYWWCTLLDPNPPQVQRCFTKKWNDHT